MTIYCIEERLQALYDRDYIKRISVDGAAPVQVCLDTRMLAQVAGTGVATYAKVLAGCLKAAGAAPARLDDDRDRIERGRLRRWVAALNTGVRAARRVESHDLNEAEWRAADVFREAQVYFNIHGRLLPIVCDNPPKVMHWTYPVPLFVVGAKNLYTVHDLIPLDAPDLTRISSERHARLINAILPMADHIVTVSEVVRRDVIARFGFPQERVVNTHQAIDAPLQRDPPLDPMLRAGRYFFFCGSVERRKNLDRLVRAHAASGIAEPLVIAGPRVKGEEDLEGRLAGAPGVIRLPYQPRDALLGLIRRARALLFPSLAEGFGLPIAEGMALGAPVMTTVRGACAETAGEAGLLVDPLDEQDMARAILALSVDDALCARLRLKGFERAKMFAAPAYARRLARLYTMVSGQDHPS